MWFGSEVVWIPLLKFCVLQIRPPAWWCENGTQWKVLRSLGFFTLQCDSCRVSWSSQKWLTLYVLSLLHEWDSPFTYPQCWNISRDPAMLSGSHNHYHDQHKPSTLQSTWLWGYWHGNGKKTNKDAVVGLLFWHFYCSDALWPFESSLRREAALISTHLGGGGRLAMSSSTREAVKRKPGKEDFIYLFQILHRQAHKNYTRTVASTLLIVTPTIVVLDAWGIDLRAFLFY